MERPNFIDLTTINSRAPSSVSNARTTGQPSPRIQHYDGEVPPILSPLDAIAAESRRLAKELETTRLAGERRMSRLPPAIVTKTLTKHHANRPACFRSLSNQSSAEVSPQLPSPNQFFTGSNAELTEPAKRPQSSYPRISQIPNLDDDDEQTFVTPRESLARQRGSDYFEIERVASPEFDLAQEQESIQENDQAHQQNAYDSSENINSLLANLAPPNAAFARNKYHTESSDDGYTSSNAGSTFSKPRKLSESSGMSFPASPALPQHERTSSNQSNSSNSSLKKPKPSFNFSRPMSTTIGMGLRVDSPTKPPSRFLERKPSHLSDVSTGRGVTSFDDDRSVVSEGFLTGDGQSFTHKKFAIPRRDQNKSAERVSQIFASLSTPPLQWQEPMFPSTPPLTATNDSGFPPLTHTVSERPSHDHQVLTRSETSDGFAFEFGDKRRRTSDATRPSSSHTLPESAKISTDYFVQRPSTSHHAATQERVHMPTLPPIPGSTADDASVRASLYTSRSGTSALTSAKSSASAHTVRPSTARTITDYQALSADEHVEKAIHLHENGDLKESTYHLRIACKSSHPTGMLLYALACRHGWGMRKDEKQGVEWLRRAVDTAMLEVADDEAHSQAQIEADVAVATRPSGDSARVTEKRPGTANSASTTSARPANPIEKKAHRTHFALAIYELGVSHMNGWGVEKDKALALRCFEIAGSWGDSDALNEAGRCYAEGIGCKKDMRQAARFYRQAAEKGVSMVGNSWIYKEKYNDVENDTKKNSGRGRKDTDQRESKEKKKRDKSKTRSIFGRKRSATTTSGGVAGRPSIET